MSLRPLRKTTESFIAEANIKHNFKFTYEKTVYTGINNIIIITCKLHGDFAQRADKHLNETYGKGGCPSCRYSGVRKDKEFLAKAQELHNNFYDYSKTLYKRTDEKVIIICPLHGEFYQTPNAHTNKNKPSGCPCCGTAKKIAILKQQPNTFTKSGFVKVAKERICTFYLLRCQIQAEVFYKIRDYLSNA